jgi:hypothetical protein
MPAQVLCEVGRIGHVLDHFHVEDHVELLARSRQVFCGRRAVVDVEALLFGVDRGGLDVLLGGIDADDLGTQPRHRLTQQTAAAADIEKAQAP